MWFKNCRIYRFTKSFTETPQNLHDALASQSFKPCGSQDLQRAGFVPPLGEASEQLVHAVNGFVLICVKRQEKVLPSAVVQEQLEDKLRQIQNDEHRHISRKERQTLKEDIQLALLPRAFVRSQRVYAYIDPQEGRIVIDTGSAKRAEEILNLLREAIGSLPVIPLACKNIPTQTMTTWLTATAPAPFALGGECELESPAEAGRVVRCKNHDLQAPEILQHIEQGMFVRKVAVTWHDALTCVLDHELNLKRLKFADELLDKVSDRQPESRAEELDQTFAVMTLELRRLLRDLESAFGGVTQDV